MRWFEGLGSCSEYAVGFCLGFSVGFFFGWFGGLGWVGLDLVGLGFWLGWIYEFGWGFFMLDQDWLMGLCGMLLLPL